MGIVGFLLVNTVVEASVLSLRAVKRNDIAITPTNNLAVLGGDLIEAEVILFAWADDFPPPMPGQPLGVHLFGVTIDSAEYKSPDGGKLTPLGWRAPMNRIPCPPTCPPAFPTCDPSPPVGCRCTTGHDPSLGGFISLTSPNFLFWGLNPIADVNTTTLNYVYFAVAPNSAVPYAGVSKYLATLILEVSPDACGSFTVSFDPDGTLIGDAANPVNISLPTLQPLTLVVSECARRLLSCSPTHCDIDARTPRDKEDLVPLTYNSIDMTFSSSTAEMTAEDFEVSLLPVIEGDIIPVIQSVTQDAADPNRTSLDFLPRIPVARWTCFRDIGSNKRCCVASLPGDVDDNRMTNSSDTYKLLDNLRGLSLPPLELEKCDIDRSQLCAPADLLKNVDLLNDPDYCTPDCPTLPVCTSISTPSSPCE